MTVATVRARCTSTARSGRRRSGRSAGTSGWADQPCLGHHPHRLPVRLRAGHVLLGGRAGDVPECAHPGRSGRRRAGQGAVRRPRHHLLSFCKTRRGHDRRHRRIGRDRAGVVAPARRRRAPPGARRPEPVAKPRPPRRCAAGAPGWRPIADFASLDSVRMLAGTCWSGRTDRRARRQRGTVSPGAADRRGIEATFAVNHLGGFLLTELLKPRLVCSAPSRVVITSSVGHFTGPWTSTTWRSSAGTRSCAPTRAPSSPTCCTRGRWRPSSRPRGSR